MTGSVPEWLEAQYDRVFARQRARVDTAKLVSTFLSGVATTLVATALQVGRASRLDAAAVLALAAAIVATWRVVQADRLREPDEAQVLRDAVSVSPPWTEAQTISALRRAMGTAVSFNDTVVRDVHSTLGWQVLLAGAASLLSIVSLLAGLAG